MTDLPPIPDEAVRAVRDAAWAVLPGDQESWTREVLAAAWPVLYATALRHAANRAPSGMTLTQSVLHMWANETAP